MLSFGAYFEAIYAEIRTGKILHLTFTFLPNLGHIYLQRRKYVINYSEFSCFLFIYMILLYR